MRAISVLLLASATPAIAAPAGPLEVRTNVLVERRVAAADGTTRIEYVAPRKIVPGDRVMVVLAYRNSGKQPIADLVLANPVPAGIGYRAAAAGSPAPEVSVDGTAFGPLAGLRVRGANGVVRPAAADDVTSVRWRLTRPVAAGAQGQLAFQAVLR